MHHVDLWRHILDAELESIQATSSSGPGDDWKTHLEGRTTSGIHLSTDLSWLEGSDHQFRVVGERGELSFSCYRAGSLRRSPGRRRLPSPRAILAGLRGGDFLGSYARQWRRVIRSLEDGSAPPATLQDGRHALRIVLDAMRSADSGAVVPTGS